MATLYYRPYTSDLQNDDGESVMSDITNRDGLLPNYSFESRKPSVDTESEFQQNNAKISDEETELERYKLAMRKMSSEILFLRDQMKNLMTQNIQLNCGSCGHQLGTKLLFDEIIDIGSITKEELLDKYVSLNSQYETACQNVRDYQQKVHQLQINLIKKNDKEVEFLKMNKAHSTQNILIQNLQRRVQKIKILEETIKDQETIIAKMESQIERNKVQKRNLSPIIEVKSARERDFNFALQEENTRLRHEIDTLRTKHDNQPAINNTSSITDSERLNLYQLLDKAEQRIIALEKQIAVNQKDWEREKKKPRAFDKGKGF